VKSIRKALHFFRGSPTTPRLRIVRFQPANLVEAVRRHLIDGVSVPVTEPARTVVDCFRHRSGVGLAVALEGLRTGLVRRRCKPSELEHWLVPDASGRYSKPTLQRWWPMASKPRNVGASVRALLPKRAEQTGSNFQILLTRYAIERVL
jgi:hypothetical protein